MNQPRPLLSVAEAVAAFDVTKRTLQRRIAAGDLTGATKDVNGHWRIPIEALHAASFKARQSATDNATGDATLPPSGAQSYTRHPVEQTNASINSATSDATEAASLRAILRDTQQQLEAERYRREAAEQNANDLRTALRMLEAGTIRQEPPLQHPAEQRPKWWQRKNRA